jgi:hypothetical protein
MTDQVSLLIDYPERLIAAQLNKPFFLFEILGLKYSEKENPTSVQARNAFQKKLHTFLAASDKNWDEFYMSNLAFFILTFDEICGFKTTYINNGGIWRNEQKPFKDLSFVAGLGNVDLLNQLYGTLESTSLVFF